MTLKVVEGIDKTTVLQLLPALQVIVEKMNAEVVKQAMAHVSKNELDGETAINLWYQITSNNQVVKRLQTYAKVQ